MVIRLGDFIMKLKAEFNQKKQDMPTFRFAALQKALLCYDYQLEEASARRSLEAAGFCPTCHRHRKKDF